MAIYVGVMDVEDVERPETGVISEFITYLSSNANRLGSYCSLGVYRLEEMEQLTATYIDIYSLRSQQKKKLHDWVQSLPWKENKRLALVFNWKGWGE